MLFCANNNRILFKGGVAFGGPNGESLFVPFGHQIVSINDAHAVLSNNPGTSLFEIRGLNLTSGYTGTLDRDLILGKC